ncbi:MAG: hypothetical protein U9R19_18020 [Bacteroidota bacterium]|nr:hypothetical protein [Bacteroidota bacterium]
MSNKRITRPSLGSTLKKKIELSKPEKEIEIVEEQIKELHSEKKKEKARQPTEELIRTTIFVPKNLYKSIKVYCAQQDDLKIKEFVTKAIQEKCKKLKLI